MIQKHCIKLDVKKLENKYFKNNRNTISNSINTIFDYEKYHKRYYEQNKKLKMKFQNIKNNFNNKTIMIY